MSALTRTELDREAMALICDATACTSNTAMALWDKLRSLSAQSASVTSAQTFDAFDKSNAMAHESLEFYRKAVKRDQAKCNQCGAPVSVTKLPDGNGIIRYAAPQTVPVEGMATSEREKAISVLSRVLKHGLDRAGQRDGRYLLDLAYELDQKITNLLGELVVGSKSRNNGEGATK